MTDSMQPIPLDPFDAATDAAISECRKVFPLYFKQVVEYFFRRLDEEIVTYFRKAEGKWQDDYFEFMHDMGGMRGDIQHRFLDRVIGDFDRFWKGEPATAMAEHEPEADLINIELMEDEALEEEYAISRVIRDSEKHLRGDLRGLDRLFAELLGETALEPERNPLSPARICRSFAEVLNNCGVNPRFRAPFYKAFGAVVLNELNAVYDALHSAARAGRPSSAGEGSATPSKEQAGASGAMDSSRGGEMAAFAALGPALARRRETSEATRDSGKQYYEYYEVLHALTTLQRTGAAETSREVDQATGDTRLKPALLRELHSQDPREGGLARGEEDVVDLTAIVFARIVSDGDYPRWLRMQMGRLQIPVAKVGVIDKSVFFNPSHPLRKLMTALVEMGVWAQWCGGEREVEQKVVATVDSILNGFELYLGLFSGILEDVVAFAERWTRRKRRAEARAVQLVESRERLTVAKRCVAMELASRTEGRPLPEFMVRFLSDIWQDVLVLACLRSDLEPESWPRLLSLTDRLIVSVTPPADMAERKRLLQILPTLVEELRAGLKRVSFDKHRRSRFFKELAVYHVLMLDAKKGMASPDVGPVSSRVQEAVSGKAADDEGAVDAIPESSAGSVPGELLEVGRWFRFSADGDRERLVKLAWVSPDADLCLLVDCRGEPFCEKSALELAEDLSWGTAAAVAPPSVSLVDDAFAAALGLLR